MEWVGTVWDLIILNPVINILIMLSDYLFGSFGLAIMVLTVIQIMLFLSSFLKRQKLNFTKGLMKQIWT